MSQGRFLIGRGTKVLVWPMNDCARVAPPRTVITVDTGAIVGATTLSISFLPALTLPLVAPFYVNAIEPNGREHLIRVTANVAISATALTIDPLLRAIPTGSTIAVPTVLRLRNAANFNDDTATADTNTFDEEGFKDMVTTLMGRTLEVPGFYGPLDAAYNNALECNFAPKEMWVRLELPPPGCDNTYTRGHAFEFFTSPTMPIAVPSDGVITSDVTMGSRGEILKFNPVAA